MRAGAVVLAVALILAPLGARGADLVVWWEKGFNPEEDAAVQEIVAAFEQKTGKQVELVPVPTGRAAAKDPGGARSRPAARLRLWGKAGSPTTLINGPLTIGSWTSPDAIGRFRTCSTRMCSRVPRCSTGAPGERACTRCRWAGSPTMSMSGRTYWSGRASPLPTSPGLGGILVFLVRPGAACRTPSPGARRHLGRRAADVARRDRDRPSRSSSFSGPHPRLATARRWQSRRGRQRSGAGSSRRSSATLQSTRKGCTPPDAADWTPHDNNKAFLEQRVVMTTNLTLSIPKC